MPDAIDQLLSQAIEQANAIRKLPVSTYRLQFHAKFTFKDATKILPYLAKLGVTHVYASPYLAATAGSTHGYDVIDHGRLNPEVGTAEDYDAFLAGLKANGLSHILDTVPNHVGVATNDNVWWNDVLEHGPASRYAGYFDITWRSSARPELQDKVLIPTLGKPYGQAVDAGELQLSFDASAGRFWVNYFERRFPISPHTYARILSHRIDELSEDTTELQSIVSAITHLPFPWQTDELSKAERQRESESIKTRLAALVQASDGVRRHIEAVVKEFNGTPGVAATFDRLDQLLDRQCFRLADWHVAFDEINYRRFFDVNDLAALSMEKPEVFEAAHAFILPLLAEGKIAGLRIDHPDGLYDPAGYLKQLQSHYLLAIAEKIYAGDDWPATRSKLLERLASFDGTGDGPGRWPLFVSVEKILAMDEPLIADWATHGTSGYDFLVMLNALFVDSHAEKAFDELWQRIAGRTPYEELAYRNKRMMLETSLASELHALTYRLDRIAQNHRRSADFTFRTLEVAIRETVACFGVYRTYIAGPTVTDIDRSHVEAAIKKARFRNPRTVPAVFDFLQDTLLQNYAGDASDEEKQHQQRFAGKFQQLTSPVTAKGIEDTTFYQYNRLLSLNEVGGEPARFGISSQRLHSFLATRQKDWPFALSGSSTHDTKRSEDVRARLNVLSDLPREWADCVTGWFGANAALRTTGNGVVSPSPADEYLIYQTLIGAWPIDRTKEPEFGDRIQAAVLKSIRESKSVTRWGEPNEAYEQGVKQFVDSLLDPERSAKFHETFDPLLKRVTHFGMLNSLSQTAIKLLSPGVPDTYQGTELWDFSLVDPDNRRPVDYGLRERLLGQVEKASMADLLADMDDGRIKLKLISAALRLRRDYKALFEQGDYVPLKAAGTHVDKVFAFARSYAGKTAVVAVALRSAQLVAGDRGLPVGEVWGDTAIALPTVTGLKNLFTGESVDSAKAADLFRDFSVAILST